MSFFQTKSLMMRVFRLKRTWAIPAVLSIWVYWYWFALPDPLFERPYSTVIEDRHGALLGAAIARDGQWRFPEISEVPDKFARAVIHFEDKRFASHWGVDPLALTRAIALNIRERRIVSGASTLTMQVIRLARVHKPRTIREKIIEAFGATRLEWSLEKSEILALYASYAPFGGNVVGLDAAAWRYFGRRPDRLSWAEAATLAVLPNNPALVHPGRNRDLLLEKRNRLLAVLEQRGVIDGTTRDLAMAEALPDRPVPLPNLAPHLLHRVRTGLPPGIDGIRMRTTLVRGVQSRVLGILDRYHQKLIHNGVFNGAVLVLDNESGNVLAYAGNTGNYTDPEHGFAVDIIPARRSTGSVLKPFLYAAMIQDGALLPQMILPDIPTRFGAYAPKNMDETYEGAVPADRALARSLNVPAVRLLREYGNARFLHLLQKMGMTTLERSADHYGLALILGGAEGSLWDLAGIYAGMARTLTHYGEDSFYRTDDFRPPSFSLEPVPNSGNHGKSVQPPVLDAAAIWHVFQALTMVNRPEARGLWRFFDSSRKIAWKTGTSFGFRDAWSIGCTPEYTVAVWIGNADGTGRPGLTGGTTAAPVMFEIFDALHPARSWFPKPERAMVPIRICKRSGFRARDACEEVEIRILARTGLRAEACPYHRIVHLDPTASWRVHGDCQSPNEMVKRSWFVLTPGMAWFYSRKNSDYRALPPFREDCRVGSAAYSEKAMELIYPKRPTALYLPIELDGKPGAAVFEVAHRDPDTTIFWHLDKRYLGATRQFHQMELRPEPGPHHLILVDDNGDRLELSFSVLVNEASSDGLP